MFNLQGRVGIVTGAGTPMGIGRSSVIQLASAGMRAIYACDIRDQHFDGLKKAVAAAAPRCDLVCVLLDVADEEATKALCQRVIKEHKRLDVFFANAGMASVDSLWETSAADVEKANKTRTCYYTVTVGPFLAVKYGAMAMSVLSPEKPEAAGSIIITGSIAGIAGGVGAIAYTAAKHAALGIARRGAIELARTRIRVNAIAPGVVMTALWQSSQELGSITREQPSDLWEPDPNDFIRQLISPDEIANVVTFLASDLSSAINAQVIPVDRGHLEQTNMAWLPGAAGGAIVAPTPLAVD